MSSSLTPSCQGYLERQKRCNSPDKEVLRKLKGEKKIGSLTRKRGEKEHMKKMFFWIKLGT